MYFLLQDCCVADAVTLMRHSDDSMFVVLILVLSGRSKIWAAGMNSPAEVQYLRALNSCCLFSYALSVCFLWGERKQRRTQRDPFTFFSRRDYFKDSCSLKRRELKSDSIYFLSKWTCSARFLLFFAFKIFSAKCRKTFSNFETLPHW